MARPAPQSRSIRPSAVLAAGAVACAAMGLGACGVTRTAFGPLQYDKSSPAAPAIASTSVKDLGYPSFLNVPSQPSDVRPTTAWNRNIFDMLAVRRQMDAFQVVMPQSFLGAEAFSQQGRADATPPPAPADTPALAAPGKTTPARATPPSPAR